MKPRNQNPLRLAARSSSLLGLFTIIFCVTNGGEATAQTWDGGGTADGLGNYNWSDGVNWVGDTAPTGGVLNFGGVTNATTFNNNTAGTSFGAINFNNNGTALTQNASFILNGNRITLNGNISTNSIVAGGAAITNVINLDMILNGDRTISLNGGGTGTGSHNLIVNGIISETGTPRVLTKGGGFPSGTLTLAGNNTYTGFTVIETGTVTVSKIADSGDSNLGYGSQITLSFGGSTGTLNYIGSGSTTNRMVQLGSSNVGQLGGTAGGTISANGTNGGTGLVFSAANFTSPETGATAASRTLNLRGSNTDANRIAGIIGNVSSSTVTNLLKEDGGRWILSGDNSYSGTSSVTGGSLTIRHNNALGSTLGGTTVSNGAQIQIDGNGLSFAAEALLINSGTSGTAGLLNISGNNTWNGLITASVQAGATNFARVQSDAGILTLAGGMTGAGADNSFVLQGAGNIDVTGAITGAIRINSGTNGAGVRSLSVGNSYTGSTSVGGGVLLLNHVTAIPGGIGLTGGASNIVLSGGILGLGNGNLTRALGTGLDQIQLTNNNAGFAAFGANRTVNLSSGAALTWGAGSFMTSGTNFVLGHATATHTLDFQNAIALGATGRAFLVNDGSATVDGRLSGAITGTSNVSKGGAGTLELSNTANAWTGTTFIDSGTLRLGAAEVLPATTVELKRAAATDTNPILDINGFNETVGAVILGITTATTTNNGQSPSVVNSATGLGAAAVLTLGGDLTYRSGVSGLFANGQATISANLATGNATRNFAVGDGSATNDLVISGVISGSGTITKTVGGTLLLSGANTYTGQLNISAGTVKLGADNTLPDAATNTVQLGINATTTNVVLDINGFSDTVGPLRINGALTGNPAVSGLTHSIIDSAGGGVLTLGNSFNVYAGGAVQYGQATISANLNTGDAARNFNVENSTAAIDLLVSGVISGAGNGFNMAGAGTTALSNANTYSGDTRTGTGVLLLQNNLALQNSALNAADTTTGTLSLDTGITTPTFGGLKGTRDLSSVITSGYSNATSLTLKPSSGSATYDGVIADGATGMILNKTGAGTQTLTNTQTYTGATNVDAGKLIVSGSIASSAAKVSGAGTILASDTAATIGSSLEVNNGAILAVGDAANAATATATVVGASTFNNGSIFSWDINANGSSYDKLVTTNVLGQASPVGDAVFRIVAADATFANAFWDIDRTWADIFTTDGSAAIANWADVFGSAVSVVNGSFASITPVDGSFSLTGSTLTWTAVPEPSSALVGLLVGAGLLRRRRA